MPPTNASVPAPAKTRPAGSVWLGTLSTFRRGPSRRGCVGSGQVVGMGPHPLLSFPTRARRGGRRRPEGRRVFTGGRGVSPAREHLACGCRRARPRANASPLQASFPRLCRGPLIHARLRPENLKYRNSRRKYFTSLRSHFLPRSRMQAPAFPPRPPGPRPSPRPASVSTPPARDSLGSRPGSQGGRARVQDALVCPTTAPKPLAQLQHGVVGAAPFVLDLVLCLRTRNEASSWVRSRV